MEIVPLGDSAVIVRVREQFEDAPEETLDEVVRTFRHLRNAAIPGVIELAPAYTSVAVFFDPVAVTKESAKGGDAFDWLAERIRAVVAAVARRLEPDWLHAVAIARSDQKSACAFASRRSRAFPRDHAAGI